MKSALLLIILFLATSISSPGYHFYKKKDSQVNFIVVPEKEITFFLVSKPGVIVGKYGEVKYFCGDSKQYGQDRFCYTISLPKGTYNFLNFDKSDTITFAIDASGAWKLGFQENHPSFTILRDDPFAIKEDTLKKDSIVSQEEIYLDNAICEVMEETGLDYESSHELLLHHGNVQMAIDEFCDPEYFNRYMNINK